MNIYAVIHGINAVTALTAASIIFFSKSRKPILLGHGWFSLLLFLYTFPYFLWGIQTQREYALLFLQLLLYAVCFIHIAYFHYAVLLTDSIKKNIFFLIFGYLISFVLAWMNYIWLFLDLNHVRARGPFLFWAHGTAYLASLIVVQCLYVLWAWLILWKSSRDITAPRNINLKSYLIIGVAGWIGGLSNWILFWDSIFIPPIGNLGVMLLTVGTFYLIFKHDFLELSQAVKKTFVYALLTLIVTMIYAIFILAGERISSHYFGYHSLTITLLSGMTITLLFNPIRSLLNRFVDRVIFGKDIAKLSIENLKMHSELQKQDQLRAVATLASGMAHEIKNPLAAIRTFTEYLPKKYDDPDFRNKFQKVILSEVGRIDGIVKQLLDFSKPQTPKLESIEIASLLEETLDPLNNTFLSRKIELIIDLAGAAKISGDKNQLKQVFLNLFLNAIQAMPEGGRLTVSCAANDGLKLLVSVSDTGHGIPKEHLLHIFEPFYTTKEFGTGLGLSIVKEIVTSHKGNISVKSEPGIGTSFIVAFEATN